jgi:polygalacturonase
VEFFNMSQIDTFKSAIRWENNVMGHSSVTNCAIHNGYGWALHVKTSRNVLIQNNVIWAFRPVGVAVQTSNNITIDNNVVGNIVARTTFKAMKLLDKEAAFAICSYNFPDPCQDVSVTNNIAGGYVYAGFVAPGHACGEEET